MARRHYIVPESVGLVQPSLRPVFPVIVRNSQICACPAVQREPLFFAHSAEKRDFPRLRRIDYFGRIVGAKCVNGIVVGVQHRAVRAECKPPQPGHRFRQHGFEFPGFPAIP